MDEALRRVAAYLPVSIAQAVTSVSDAQAALVREIRLRSGAAVTLSLAQGEHYLLEDGRLSSLLTSRIVTCTKQDVEECVKRLCEYALHTHQEELKQGFLTVCGCRAGLAGTVVTDAGGAPQTMRDITSVCLRVARVHRGGGRQLAEQLCRKNAGGLLLCGPPGSGKTSVLRDMAEGLSRGFYGEKRRRVAVVDERSELSFSDTLSECDVLRGGTKAAGIERAVRCLCPEFLVVDEWVGALETNAISFAVASGVRVITGVHAPSVNAALSRREVRELWNTGAFSLGAELKSGYRIKWVQWEDAYEMEWTLPACPGADGVGISEKRSFIGACEGAGCRQSAV